MLKFGAVRNVFLLSITLLVFLNIAGLPAQLWQYLAIMLPFLAFITFGAFNIQSNIFIEGQHQLSSSNKEIAVTFDDGPCPDHTPEVLKVLAKYQVKATFFCIGKAIEANPELFREIIRKGHSVGNHTYSHSNLFPFFNQNKMEDELQTTNALIRHFTGEDNVLFRPPFGVTNPGIARAVKYMQLRLVGWSIRSFDTSNRKPQEVIATVKKQLKPGAIILFHDNRPGTAQVLDEILHYTKEQAYTCVAIPNSKLQPS